LGKRGRSSGRGRGRGRGRGSRGSKGKRSGNRWIQSAVKRPGRVKNYLKRKYGNKAFTKSGEIKHSYVLKAIKDVKENMPPSKRRQSLLNALHLAKRFETLGKGKRGK